VLGLPDGIRACLFDMDGVLTETATVHARAWKSMFDDYLRRRDGDDFKPFTQDDYDEYVDGKPRYDGVESFLASRGIELPQGLALRLPERRDHRRPWQPQERSRARDHPQRGRDALSGIGQIRQGRARGRTGHRLRVVERQCG
jgi:phosphoglycolate phosphatase-like HAD superfamily hydrolase